jgi:hypothetical protein
MGVFFYVQIYSTIFFWYTILNLIMYRGLIARISFFNVFMSKKIYNFSPPPKKSQICMGKHKFSKFFTIFCSIFFIKKKKNTLFNSLKFLCKLCTPIINPRDLQLNENIV